MMFWGWSFIILLVLLIALLPPWPYMREREMGYWPSGIVLAVLVLLLLFWWFGAITMWTPTHTPTVR